MSFFTSTSAAVKFENVGDDFRGTITAPVTERQAKVFGSEELAFWPAKNGRPAEPKMEAVINLLDSTTGMDRTLYVPKGRMQKAIGQAMAMAGSAELAVGGELYVKHTGTEKGKGTFPAKTFTAEYKAPNYGTAAPSTMPQQAAPVAAVAEDPWG